MSQVGNNENRFGGEFMVQDSDHMSGIDQSTERTNRSGGRQADQSQVGGRQQGNSDQSASGQQGGERRAARGRQAH